MTKENKNETHFGYKKVNSKEKPDLVKEVFDSVSNKYDLMNDLMSLGCLLYTSPSPRDSLSSRMPSSA